MSSEKVQFPLWSRAALWAMTLGIIVLVGWALLSPAVPPEKSRMLRKGMAGGEVLELLGEPLHVRRKANGNSIWQYGSPLKRSTLKIEFSQNEQVILHRQDVLVSKGAFFWVAEQACKKLGASEKAHDMEFKRMCATMGWEGLQYRCKDEADRALLDAEVINFFNTHGNQIPNYNAWNNWRDTNGAERNIVVTNSSKALEDFLRKRGYYAE